MNDQPRPSGPSGSLTERQLLQTVVEVARGVFGAAASSIFLVDRQTGELVFEAVSGEGEALLPGTRFPHGTGIAGWVAESGQPLLAEDVADTPQFQAAVAESTGYVPRSIMAAPLIRDGECIGVLEILDRAGDVRDEAQDVGLIGLLSTQAAIGLEMLMRLRLTVPDETTAHRLDACFPLLQRIADRLPLVDKGTADMTLRLLTMADETLSAAHKRVP